MHILITGGSRGIGAEAVRYFTAQGHRVRFFYHRSRAQAEALARETGAEAVPCDVADPEAVCAGLAGFGPVDVLINNAGISHIGLLQDMTLEQWDTMLRTDLTSVFLTCRAAIPLMLPQKSGSIVNVSSVWGNVGASCEAAYSAAKSGVNGLTRALAKELAPSGIRVNAAAFGAIETSMNEFLAPEEKEALTEEIPAGRFGTPREAAALLYDLAVHHPYLTGQVITMDGGWI